VSGVGLLSSTFTVRKGFPPREISKLAYFKRFLPALAGGGQPSRAGRQSEGRCAVA
jgi:hypothetical protein